MSAEWPTEPGWYWVRDGDRELEVGRVIGAGPKGETTIHGVGSAFAYKSEWPNLRWLERIPEPTGVDAEAHFQLEAPPSEAKVWLFRVVAPDVDGDHWGTCSALTKMDALARVQRRMSARLETDGHGEFKEGTLDVQVWEHDDFTIAGSYL